LSARVIRTEAVPVAVEHVAPCNVSLRDSVAARASPKLGNRKAIPVGETRRTTLWGKNQQTREMVGKMRNRETAEKRYTSEV
jgi:hypothetical protein